MKKSKNPRLNEKLKKIFIALILAGLVIYALFFFGIIKEDCEQDEDCFNYALENCDYAKFNTLQNNNHYKYEITNRNSDTCTINIKIEKMALGTPIDKVLLFEGKEMNCEIPREKLKEIDIKGMGDFLNHCSGPLKESIYEEIITKMYGIVIKNLGPIIAEINTSL